MCGNHEHDTTTAETSAAEAAVAAEASGGSCCGGHAAASPGAPVVSAQDEVAECPVMPGSMVDKAAAEAAGLYRDFEGKRYWFCCAACGPMWDADPHKYAAA